MSAIIFFILLGSTAGLSYWLFSAAIKDEYDFEKILRLLFKVYIVFVLTVTALWALKITNGIAVQIYAFLFALETFNQRAFFHNGYYATLFRGYESPPWKRRFIFNLSLNFSMLLSTFCLIIVKAI